jgi:hypothetical protein
MLIDQQVHDQRAQVDPVAAGRRGHRVGQRRDVLTPAPAADPVHIVLTHHDPDLGQVMGLMGTFDAHLGRLGQVRPARAVTVGAVRHMLIRGRHPWQ